MAHHTLYSSPAQLLPVHSLASELLRQVRDPFPGLGISLVDLRRVLENELWLNIVGLVKPPPHLAS